MGGIGELGESWIGSSAEARAVRALAGRLARSGATVLLTGETGTGKGLVARQIHARGPRCEEPFVHVDCVSLSPTVIESELFGHERGAFTHALARRPGRLELAGRGTLFLDEVGDLDPPLQAKLLRVLQDRAFERVGGVRTLPLQARVIAATHRDLPARVERGLFRADLFYRLDVLHLEVPPLRARIDDLPELAAALLARAGAPSRLSGGGLERLRAHPWPGNVRELSNVLERCAAFAEGGVIDAAAVERALVRGARRAVAVRPDERERIAAALLATGGNVRRAARRLGVARSTLRYRIQRHALEHLLARDRGFPPRRPAT